MTKKAVVLLSGGLDSSTALAVAKDEGYDVHAISFNYQQRHRVELEAAKKIAAKEDVKSHRIVEFDLRQFGGSALTSDIEVPKDRDLEEMVENIPVTYVPGRNTIFLSHALSYAEIIDANAIYTGVNALDYSGYPDCRPEFIEAYQNLVNFATKATTEDKREIIVKAPLIHLSKVEIIKLGDSLGVDFSLTHSCYDPTDEGLACGVCDSCILRRDGFKEAGIPDPTKYIPSVSFYSAFDLNSIQH